MTTKAPKPARNKYDTFTEQCPKMTRRWRREVIPEIATWLTVHKCRIERQALHVKQAAQFGKDDALREAHAKLMMRVGILTDLIRTLADKWDDYLWWELAASVEEMLGPLPSKPNFNPGLPGMNAKPAPVKGATDGRPRRRNAGATDPAGAGVHQPGRG